MSHHSPRHKQIGDDYLVLLTEVGSGLHGVTIGGTDDHDQMGICVPPPETVMGLEKFEQYIDRWHADGSRIAEGERSGHGDTDHTVYSLAKWARLAAQGNPTVLMPMFAPESKVYVCHDVGTSLRQNKDLFLSKQAGHRFIGYLQAQKERMLGLRGRKHTNRPELVEVFGFDTKMAYHALRLAHQGWELMTYEDITLPMDPDWVKLLRDIRNGVYTREDVVEMIEFETELLEQAMETSSLPDEPDHNAINNWLIGQHYGYWTEKGLL